MELGLKDKTVVITGGASGLGLESARYFAREGAKLVLADINGKNLATASSELKGIGAKVETLELDVRDYAGCEKLAQLAASKCGGVDVLLAGAGVGGSHEFFVNTKPSDWDLMLDINVRGVLNTNRAIAPLMVEQGRGGSIINIASEAGKVGEKRIVVYSATKGAVIAFSKAFSLEMGRFKIRVNAVCPGVTRTPMTVHFGEPGSERYEAASKFYPMGRLGEPEDIAAFITFLGSNQSSWITGQGISVSGGFGRS